MLVVVIAVGWIVLSIPVALLVGRCLALNDEAFFDHDERQVQPHDIPTHAHGARIAAAAIGAGRAPIV